MKIIEEDVDLKDFKAWSEGRNVLDKLIEYGTVDKAQAWIEELFPDGITDTQLNDYLWFEIEDDHPEWFDDYREEKEDIRGRILSWMTAPGPLGFIPLMEADGGTLYRLAYEDDDDDFTVFKLVAEAEWHANGGSGWTSEYEVDYDFSKSLDDNIQALKDEMAENGVLPALCSGLEYVEDFPTWALDYCINGDSTSLSKEEKKMVDEWMDENGYGSVSDSVDHTRVEFNKYPAFGPSCETETVVMVKKKEDRDAEKGKGDPHAPVP